MSLLNLEGLESVDWGGLEHAYGVASDVPDLVAGLWSSDAEAQVWALWERVAHQGTRYSATAPVVPFLVTAASDRSVTVRTLAIELVGFCGMGYVDQVLDWPRQHAHQSSPAEMAAWDAVVDDHPRLRGLLSDPDPMVTQAALAVLVWTGDSHRQTMTQIKGLIQSGGEGKAMCRGWLAAAVSGQLPEGIDPPPIVDAQGLEARFGQAMAAIHFGDQQVPTQAVDELVGVIGSIEATNALADCSLLWHEEAGLYAAEMLSRVPPQLVEHTATALLDRMRLGSDLGSLALGAYLNLYVTDLERSRLTNGPVDPNAATVLSRMLPIIETWDLSHRGGTIAELEQLGLPDTPKELSQWIASGHPSSSSRRPWWKLLSR